MTQSVPWSVKGVEPDARETAKDLARRSGMTLGQWLNTMIAEQGAGDAPSPSKQASVPFGKIASSHVSAPSLAAIARKLEAMGASRRFSADRHSQRDVAAGSVSEAVLARHIRASEARMAELLDKVVRRQEESEAHMAALMDAMVDTLAEAGVSTVNAGPQTSSAVGQPQSSENAASDDIDTSAADLEHRLAALGADSSTAPAQPEIEAPPADRLSQEIASLTREIAELRRSNALSGTNEAGFATLRTDIAALGRHLDERMAGLVPAGQFTLIDKKLDLLARQTQDPTVLAAIQRETADIRERLSDRAPNADHADLVGHIERLSDRFRPVEEALEDLRGSSVSKEGSGIEHRLDTLQTAVEEKYVSTSASLSEMMLQLGKVLEATAHVSRDAPSSDNVALTALEIQVRKVAEGIGVLCGEGGDAPGIEPVLASASALSPLHGLPEELRRLFDELRGFQDKEAKDTRKTLEALQATLHQLSARLRAIEDLARARTVGTVISGPPDIGDTPPLFGRERPDDITWSRELPRSLVGDAPAAADIERNTAGRPSQVSALGNEARSSFIAAARRAARAAAEADGSLSREAKTSENNASGPFYQRHKRSILLGLAAITMMMGALQAGRLHAAPREARTRATAPLLGAPPQAMSFSAPTEHSRASSLYDEARALDRAEASTLDLAKAAGLYRLAAAQGQLPALFRLGLAYDRGRGVGHDPVLAGLWYQRAADHGSVKAMHNLAILYASGAVMGSADYEQAARWFHQAAERGHACSQYNFALLAAQGIGTPRDLALAYRYLALAAAQGDRDAAGKRDEVGPRLSPGERAAIDEMVGRA
jgi:TPR repeat protein